MLQYDVEGVNDAWNEAKERQQDIEPKVSFETDLKKHPSGGKITAKIILIGSVAVNAM